MMTLSSTVRLWLSGRRQLLRLLPVFVDAQSLALLLVINLLLRDGVDAP